MKSQKPCLRQRRPSQRGSSLIEVLVAVLLLSFGMLGMSALQMRALQGNQSALQRSQAIMLNHYIMDAMRVDREQARGGSYNINNVCDDGGIPGNSLAANNLRLWLQTAERNLGQENTNTVCGTITCVDATLVCTVRLSWDDDKASGDPTLNPDAANVELVSRL